ncbi:MAG: FeoA family protein [Halobacteriota archaeon]|nr:FeoA family protein [Halobacteriota archaeon]
MRTGGRISGYRRVLNHFNGNIKHIHDDIDHLGDSHGDNEEIKSHRDDVDSHLHDLMAHGKDLGKAIPLALLSEGEEGEVIGFNGGRGMLQRLSEMGFTPLEKVKVIKSNSSGPVLVDVKGSRIALGRGVAMKIIVNGVEV